MTIDTTRRGFLKGLVGVTVIAALPNVVTAAVAESPAPITVEQVQAPVGMTYNWVRTSLLGEPDIENLMSRINNGWSFVIPSQHPGLHTEDASVTVERQGLILMQCPTIEVELRRMAEQFIANERQPEGFASTQRSKLPVYQMGYYVTNDGEIKPTSGTTIISTVDPAHSAVAEKWRKRSIERQKGSGLTNASPEEP